MSGDNDSLLNNNWKRILFILFAFVMLYLVAYVINPFSKFWHHYLERPWIEILPEFALSISFCVLISESSIFINRRFNIYIPWTERPLLRMVTQTIAYLLNTLLMILLQLLIGYFIFDDYRESFGEKSIRAFLQWITTGFSISLMISTIYTLNYLITNWKRTAVEAAEHKRAAAEAEVHALKLQVDPHFVFNNLSVLSEIILTDQQLGYEYAENFTKVYRYLLLNSRKDLITLDEELKFLSAYSFLISNRLGAGVHFSIHINPAHLGMQLPPLTMQILIEHILKHNKILKTDPLQIDIYTEEKAELIVANTLAPMDLQSSPAVEALNHIMEKYSLIHHKQPEIVQNATFFSIRIPLLEYKETDGIPSKRTSGNAG